MNMCDTNPAALLRAQNTCVYVTSLSYNGTTLWFFFFLHFLLLPTEKLFTCLSLGSLASFFIFFLCCCFSFFSPFCIFHLISGFRSGAVIAQHSSLKSPPSCSTSSLDSTSGRHPVALGFTTWCVQQLVVSSTVGTTDGMCAVFLGTESADAQGARSENLGLHGMLLSGS